MIVLVRVDPETAALLRQNASLLPDLSFEDVPGPEQLATQLADGGTNVDALVLGAELEEPVRVAQRAHIVDEDLAVLILSDPSRHRQLSQAVQFAPFLGSDVIYRSVADGEALAVELREAVLRTRQRRSERATIAAVNAAVAESNPRQLPAAQYVDRLLDAAPIGVVMVDGHGLILALNPKAATILEQGGQQLLGASLAHLFPESERGTVANLALRCAISDQQPPPEVVGRTTADGGSQFVEVTATALPTRIAKPRVLILLQDVTGRMVAEQERRRAEDELRARVRQQATVAELGQRALAGSDLATLMNEVAIGVAQTLEVEYSRVLELLPDGDALILRAGVGWEPGAMGHTTVRAGTDSQAGYTLLSGDPVIIENWQTETRFRQPPLLRDHGVTCGVSVIIQGQERSFGVLGADSVRRRLFTTEDIHFLQAVANVLAMAVERKRAEEVLDTRLRYEAGLAACSQALLTSASPNEALTQALHHLLQASGASRVYIFENFEDAADGLCVRQTLEACGDGVTPQIDNPLLQHFPYNGGFSRWREELSQRRAIGGLVKTLPQSEQDVLEPQEILSILVIPVFVGNDWYGFIGFDDVQRRREWSQEDVQLLRTAAEMIGMYIERWRAGEALQKSNQEIITIFESITDAFFALDCEWRFVYVNREAERLLGKTETQIGAKNVWDEFPEAVGSSFQREYQRAMAEQVEVEFEAFYPPLDTWFEVHAYPSEVGLSVYFRDITGR
ncbi:MAG TPA: hypothetical protein DEP84_31745, partial [Chloroflexi bacterium]|nr:hypothetical protein [Chloroflexota bacterium]